MRKHILFIFIMLITVCTLKAQCVQKVRVLEYKGEGVKTPLANVEVVVGNASSAVTDKKGCCTLNFRTLKPGDRVTVRSILKTGYEVLNPEVLSQWAITRDPKDEYVIVMASSRHIEVERDKYLRAAERSISKSMMQEQTVIGKQFNANQISKAEYEKRIEQLRIEYNQKLDNIDNYIDRMVHTDINEIADHEKAVLEQVRRGDLSGAIQAYDSISLISLYKQQLKVKEALDKASRKLHREKQKKEEEHLRLYSSMKRQNDLLLMAGGFKNFQSGISLWHDFAYADTTFYLPLYEYARYCERNNMLDEALDALKYVRHSTDTVTLLRGDLLSAVVQSKMGRYKNILPNVEAAYRYIDSVRTIRHDSTMFLAERSWALTILCKSYTALNYADKARQIRPLVIEAARQSYEWDKDNHDIKSWYVDALYEAYNSCFTLDFKGADPKLRGNADILEQQSAYLDEAIGVQEELYNENPAKHSAILAFLDCEKAIEIRNVTRSRNDSTQFEKIEAEYVKALETYGVAYEHNPRSYAHFVSDAYLNYGALYFDYGKFDEKDKVIDLFLNAKKYEEEELEYNPKATRRNHAYILWALGFTYFRCGDYANAELCYLESAEELRPLYSESPMTVWSIYDNVYYRLYELYGREAMNDETKLDETRKMLDHLEADYRSFK